MLTKSSRCVHQRDSIANARKSPHHDFLSKCQESVADTHTCATAKQLLPVKNEVRSYSSVYAYPSI